MNQETVWTVRVTAKSPHEATALARGHQLKVGAPVSFDTEYESVTALENFLAVVGSDVVTGMLLRAKKHRISFDSVEATLDCWLNNPLTFLDVVGEEGDPAIKRISMVVYVSTLASSEEIQRLWQNTLQKSPLVQTLQNAVELDLHFKIVL